VGAGHNAAGPCHIESHAALLQQPADGRAPQEAPEVIVVPTIRPQSLQPAARLADRVGSTLVVLCSTPGQARQALAECQSITGNLFVTYVPPSVDRDLLPFLTLVSAANDDEPSCHIDIARKRNIGLLLARLCGWHTIMYLDDDIRGLTPPDLGRAAALTMRFPAVGFRISHYPDNSVVCHAHRLAGGQQDVFPGGSALLIDATRCDMLFPPVYNEDWLFLFSAVQNGSFAVAGTLSQLEYLPFARPERAVSEEFGDVIAEGLYRLIHEGVNVTEATQVYWRDVLGRRSQLIDDVATRLLRRDTGDPLTGSALRSMAAARDRLTTISPQACVSFIHAWQSALDTWRHGLTRLPMLGDLVDAAKFLGLPARESWVNQ
jgi:hypothetical protein